MSGGYPKASDSSVPSPVRQHRPGVPCPLQGPPPTGPGWDGVRRAPCQAPCQGLTHAAMQLCPGSSSSSSQWRGPCANPLYRREKHNPEVRPVGQAGCQLVPISACSSAPHSVPGLQRCLNCSTFTWLPGTSALLRPEDSGGWLSGGEAGTAEDVTVITGTGRSGKENWPPPGRLSGCQVAALMGSAGRCWTDE